MLQPWLQPETRWRRSTSRRSRGRSSGGPARTRRSALGGSDEFGHPGRFSRGPSAAPSPGSRAHAPRSARAPLTLRPTQASALLQPGRAGCRRGRGARWARRGRHVLHGIGSRRSDRKAGRSPRQVASAGAGAVLSLPTARCWRARGALPVQARAGTGAQGADVTSLVGTSCQLFSSHARSIGAPTSTLASPAPLPEV